MGLLFYSSRGQKPKISITGLKGRCRQGSIPSGGSRAESVSLPFPAFRGRLQSLAHGPSSTFTAINVVPSVSLRGHLSLVRILVIKWSQLITQTIPDP